MSATGPRNVWTGGSECTGGGPPGTSVTAAYVARYDGHTWLTRKWNTSAFCGGALVTTGRTNGWLLGDNQALHFTGKRWQKVTIGLGQPTAATAVSAKDIWTVGGRFNASHLSRSKVFFTHYNGRRWRAVPLPAIRLPKNGYLYPYDIDAASANSIWAVATIYPAAVHSFLLHFNGTKWKAIPLPATPQQLLQVVPDGSGGAWATMFQSIGGEYQFAHYSNGKWSFDAVPTNGLPGLVAGSEAFDVYSIARIPGTRSLLGTGDVFYSDSTGTEHNYSLIFRYMP